MDAREAALKALHRIHKDDSYASLSLGDVLNAFEARDKAFITELVYGVITYRIQLDYIISRLSSIKLRKLSHWIIEILRLGLYQMLYMDRVPDEAAVNESVKLARRYGHRASSGFVNAILRNAARGGIPEPDEHELPLFLSVRYAHPQWLVERWLNRWGRDKTERLLAANNQRAPLCVRVNTLKTTVDALSAQLGALPGGLAFEALILPQRGNPAELPGFRDGLFTVQDSASQLAAHALNPLPGQRVLDMCAAPGGKTTHIAQLMENNGEITAWDIHTGRLALIEQTAARLGVTIIKAALRDAAEPVNGLSFDRVLLDAPCSGLGIMRRKPDIRHRRKPEDIPALARLQSGLIRTAAGYVKPGGLLVYSTCTTEPEENTCVVHGFLAENPDFSPEDLSHLSPMSEPGCIELFPDGGSDGFFISCMRKNKC